MTNQLDEWFPRPTIEGEYPMPDPRGIGVSKETIQHLEGDPYAALSAYDMEAPAAYQPPRGDVTLVASNLARLMGIEYVYAGEATLKRFRIAAKKVLINAKGDLSTAMDVLRDMQGEPRERSICERAKSEYVVAGRVNVEVSRRQSEMAKRTDPGKYDSYLEGGPVGDGKIGRSWTK